MVGLVPVVAAMVVRQAARWWGGDGRPVEGAPAAGDLARELLRGAGVEAKVELAGRLALPGGPGGPLRLPAAVAGRRDAAALGVAVQEAGLMLLGRELAGEVALRRRVLRFGAAGPAFALVVAVFAGLAMRAAFGWVLAAVVLLAGLASAMNLLTGGIEVRAAARGVAQLRRLRLALRGEGLDRIERAARAAAWRRALPASLAWLLP